MPEVVDCGTALLAWLDGIVASNVPIRFVGHRGLGPGDRLDESGDEQPVEVAALAAAHLAAYHVNGGHVHHARVGQCLDWFSGLNRLGVAMVDADTGAGYDGLGTEARNDNRGAESTIAYLMTALSASQLDQQRER